MANQMLKRKHTACLSKDSAGNYVQDKASIILFLTIPVRSTSEALAVGLDYFVPSRKGQFSVFIDVLKQARSNDTQDSSFFLLEQLLGYFSDVGTLYRLLTVRHPGLLAQ